MLFVVDRPVVISKALEARLSPRDVQKIKIRFLTTKPSKNLTSVQMVFR